MELYSSQDMGFMNKNNSRINKPEYKNDKKEYEKELKMEDIDKMRDKLDSLNPQKIIDDILKKSKKKDNLQAPKEKALSKDNYLENLKNTAMNNFIESERNRSLQEIRTNFDEKLKEFKKATELYAEKKHKENLEYLNQLNAFKNKNVELDTTIHHLNQESKLLKEQLKQYEDNIFKLQSKFEIFERLKPIFEEFFKEFPDQNPISVIQEIKEKKEASVRMINDINDLTRIKFELESEKKEIFTNYEKKMNYLEQKLKALESINKESADQHYSEVKQLKAELKVYEEYKKENLKMHNMLFQLYNKLIERLKLNREISISSHFLITEGDFEPNLFDNKEIISYIDAMLTTSHEEMSSKMLRETIAYANMMLRTYLKDKLKNKFNPVETFKEIKNYIDSLTVQLNDSENNRKKLQREVNELNNRAKKLENEIKYNEVQFEGYKKKFDLQINERIIKSREQRNKMIKIKGKKRKDLHNRSAKNSEYNEINNSKIRHSESDESLTIPRQGNNPQKIEDEKYIINNAPNHLASDVNINKSALRPLSALPLNKIKEEKEDLVIENKENEITNITKNKFQSNGSRLKSGNSDQTTRPNTAIKNNSKPKTALIGYYLTHNKFFKKENFDKLPNDTKTNAFSTSPNKNSNINNNLPDLEKISEFNHNQDIDRHKNQKYKKSRYDSERYNMIFKDMIIAKNNDKLLKCGGFTMLPSHTGALKNLVDQTNKLFLYKQKVTLQPESKNIFNKFHKNIENKFKLIKSIKPDIRTQEEYDIGLNIVSDINAMIKNLEKKD